MIKAITFDFWDTIVSATDYTDVRINLLTSRLEQEGYSIPKESVKAAYHAALRDTYKIREEKQRCICPSDRIERVIKYLNIYLPGKIKKEIKKTLEGIVLFTLPPLVHDADKVIRFLYRHFKIGLICDTGMSPGNVLRKVLKKHSILKYFCCTVFSDEIGWTKPNPIIFKSVLKQLKLNPDEVLHIGDLLATDITGAKYIGMKTVWFNPIKQQCFMNNTNQKKRTNIQPDYEINKLSQLVDLLC